MEYRYDTKIAAQMEAKILGPMAYSKRLQKPLLIITITDGEPSDKPKDRIVQVIQECRRQLTPLYGPKAVAFQFAQVRGGLSGIVYATGSRKQDGEGGRGGRREEVGRMCKLG